MFLVVPCSDVSLVFRDVLYKGLHCVLLLLLNRFGIGYHMTVVKETGCDSRKIIDIVKGMVTGSSEVTDVGAELSFRLPSDSRNQFPDMFDTLESELRISTNNWKDGACFNLTI